MRVEAHSQPEGVRSLTFRATRDWPRLDVFIASEAPGITRAAARRLILQGAVFLDGSPTRPGHQVRTGQQVHVSLPEPAGPPRAEPWRLARVYEDDHIVVVDKPAGLVVHPAPGHPASTLVNMLLDAYTTLPSDDSARPGIVHRLDRDTSGLLIVAKTEAARAWLVEQFKQGTIHKTYLALVLGTPPPTGQIEQPIARHPARRKEMAVVEGGRYARTSFEVIERLGEYTLIAAMPTTGRTHQIRVHLAHIGHPVAGDPVYGGRLSRSALKGILGRQFLHAHRLVLNPPWLDHDLDLVSSLPPELLDVLQHLRDRSRT